MENQSSGATGSKAIGAHSLNDSSDSNVPSDEEIKFLLAEYKALRAEHLARGERESQLTTIAIALLGGLAAATPIIVFSSTSSPTLRIPGMLLVTGLLISAVLFTSLLWGSLENQLRQVYISLYIEQNIRAQVAQHLKLQSSEVPVLNWDRFRVSTELPRIRSVAHLLSWLPIVTRIASRFSLMGISALLALFGAVFVYFSYSSFPPSNSSSWFNIVLFILSAFYFLLAVVQALYLLRLLRGIPPHVFSIKSG